MSSGITTVSNILNGVVNDIETIDNTIGLMYADSYIVGTCDESYTNPTIGDILYMSANEYTGESLNVFADNSSNITNIIDNVYIGVCANVNTDGTIKIKRHGILATRYDSTGIAIGDIITNIGTVIGITNTFVYIIN